jgi:zinc transport system substrate-binding protein
LKKLLIAAIFVLTGCGQGSDPRLGEGTQSTGQTAMVYTVNYPLYWMAKQLASAAATVVFPAPVGEDPALWRPDVETVLQFQQGDLVLLNGAGYAKWVASASLPASPLVDTSAAYHDQLLVLEAGPAHTHGPTGEHSHGELAFTTWLDLDLARQQSEAVAGVLQRLLPDESESIKQRLAALHEELDDMDVQLKGLGQKLDGAPLLYSHPVYQYLQRRYRLNGKALHWEPGEVPDEVQWEELAELLRVHPARVMLWEAEPLPQVTRRLGELGIKVVVFAPLGKRPEEGDFISNLEANIQALAAALD